jgi:hypothetical protein
LPHIGIVEPSAPGPLIPELRDAELTLEHALATACAAKPASQANTGELIRVEEVLALASAAAKRAISLRRRRGAERRAMNDAEAAASGGAIYRTFTDARGIEWYAFAVYPEMTHAPLHGTFEHGWLCFESAAEKRRLSPIPADWLTVSPDTLAKLAEQAERAMGRRGGRGREEQRPGR